MTSVISAYGNERSAQPTSQLRSKWKPSPYDIPEIVVALTQEQEQEKELREQTSALVRDIKAETKEQQAAKQSARFILGLSYN